MNRLNEKNLGTAPDNHSMGDINDITASTRGKTRLIRNISGNSTERTTKVLQLIQYFIQLCQHKIYLAHTLLIAQMQIRRECPLFIRGFSNWAFSTSLTERHKQTIWCPEACTTVAAGFDDKLIQKAKMRWNLEPRRNNTSKFLIRLWLLPSSEACSNSSQLRLRLWTTSETSDWRPQLAIPGVWPSVSTPVET